MENDGAGFTIGKDGACSEMTNLIANKTGAIERLQFPTDAVIIQLFRREDEDGNPYWERVVTTSVVHHELQREILDEARRLLPFIRE